MKKFSVLELRKTIVAAEAERLKLQQPFPRESLNLEKNRKSIETVMSRWMKDSGLDLDQLQALHNQREAELERLTDAHKKEALRLAAQRKNKLAIAAQGKTLAGMAAESGIFPNPSFSLDTPFLIWPTPSMSLESSAAPFNSWAKFRLLTSQSGTQKVSFYFYWVNNFSDYAVISAATYLSATGYLRAHAPFSLFSANRSSVDASAWFGLWFGVSSDLNSADYVTADLGGTSALEKIFAGDVNYKTIFASASLSKTVFPVPPGNVVVFEVALAVESINDSGNTEADFQTGYFQTACPVVVFWLLNSPPGPLVVA